MKQHFVTFLSPGTFVAESSTQQIDSWDVEKAKKMSKGVKERYAATPYGFYFSTRERGENDLDSKETKRSGMYFLGGRLLDAKQVEKEIKNPSILLSNMSSNGWKHVVVNDNSWRTIQPFEKGDVLL